MTPFQGWVREDWDVRAKIIERKTELDQHKEKQRELKELENKEKNSKLAATAAAAPAAASAPMAVKVAPDVALPPQFGDTVKLRVRKQTIKHKYNGFLAVVTDNSLSAALWVQLLEGPEINGIFRILRAQAEIVRRAPPKDDTPTEIGNGVAAPATPAAPAVQTSLSWL